MTTPTTMTTTAIVDFHTVVSPPCSNPPACCISLTTSEMATCPNEDPTPLMTTLTPMIHIIDDDDAMPTTQQTMTTLEHMITIANNNAAMTMPPHDATTHPHPTLDFDLPQTPYAPMIHPSWLRDSFFLVSKAIDRLEDAIVDMSTAIADLSARIETMLSKPPMPPWRFTVPPNKTQQHTSQPFPNGLISSYRSQTLLPLPVPKPPFTHKNKFAIMHSQPHQSPSFPAMLLRMAKHNYRPP